MKQLSFFATRPDLLRLLEGVEAMGALVYTQMGRFNDNAEPPTFRAGNLLPGLGEATADTTSACTSFLLCEPSLVLRRRVVAQQDGTVAVFIDQLENSDTISFTPGGLRHGILISGRVASAIEGGSSSALMSRFKSVLRRSFEKVAAFYVGPDAARLFDSGTRLTFSAPASPDFDLRRQ